MFPSQIQALSRVLAQGKTPTQTQDGIQIYKVEELPCKSSTAIIAIGYNPSKSELYIQWKKNSSTNCYFRVPYEVWQEFITCTGSIGNLYHQRIKGNYDSHWHHAGSNRQLVPSKN